MVGGGEKAHAGPNHRGGAPKNQSCGLGEGGVSRVWRISPEDGRRRGMGWDYVGTRLCVISWFIYKEVRIKVYMEESW